MHKFVVNVVGMTKFSGTVGEGNDRQHIKVVKLFALMPMEAVDKKDADQELGRKGSQVVEYKTDDLRIFDALKSYAFPVECEIEIETYATGKGGTKDVLQSAKARGSVKAA